MPYSLLHYPDITPPAGSDERPMGPYEALWRCTGIHSGSAQVAEEVESRIRSALPSGFNNFGVPDLPLPGCQVSDPNAGPPLPHQDHKPQAKPFREDDLRGHVMFVVGCTTITASWKGDPLGVGRELLPQGEGERPQQRSGVTGKWVSITTFSAGEPFL